MSNVLDLSFFKDKTVFLTGHTGFKGSWLSVLLLKLGARVIGYSSCTKKELSLFELINLSNELIHIKGDVRDYDNLNYSLNKYKPNIVIHMAAQPLVREGYKDPLSTYSTNVMGTVNICEAIRNCDSVRSFLNVTTDKVYENKEWEWGYRENEILDGFDPYSNSKSCSELVTHCYINSFFKGVKIPVSTARAGNVIGGGDFANFRIIPDCVRAALNNDVLIVRNPHSVRPYQHVLEPLYAYLMIVASQYNNYELSGFYNVGPNDSDCISTGRLVELFLSYWGKNIEVKFLNDNGPHEANYLKLDCSKLKRTFNWNPRWSVNKAVEKVVEWSKFYEQNKNIRMCMDKQISEFLY